MLGKGFVIWRLQWRWHQRFSDWLSRVLAIMTDWYNLPSALKMVSLLTLEEVAGISNPVAQGDKYGYCLETVDDLNMDGYDELLICSIDYQQSSDTGKS